MRNIKFLISYDGTRYNGWQIQKKVQSQKIKTIQGEIEGVLARILQERVKVIGSGRTDSGVHAIGQAANFKTHSKLPLENILKGVNGCLKDDIRILKADEVDSEFHARYRAKRKKYRYSIINALVMPPMERLYCAHIRYPLNLALIKREAAVLVGRHNFKAFQAAGSSVKDTIRTIVKSQVTSHKSQVVDGKKIIIEIEADGFLYNMVRNIVGTLVEIGRGKLPQGSMKRILKGKDRKLAGPTAPAQGLCLIGVEY